ncbi:TIGR03749 family integrating conjugative element protein [Salmonella enterica subsp. enterica]|nr:TIGR03749 family integrating conjugative element protein [Salmonella enterica subsp. enterica]
MKLHLRNCLFSLPLLLCNNMVIATELMQWQRLPLPVELHTGHERVIFVNRNVRVGYPAELDGKLRIQSSGGTVYLRASEDFPDSRLQLFDMDSGELILLDVHARAGNGMEPLELRYDDTVWRNDGDTSDIADDGTPDAAVQEKYDAPLPVVLTRHAAQMLYAPLRTVEPVANIAPVPVRLPATVTTLLPGEPVTATPLAAWRLGEMTVTAIKLQNRSANRIDLDPRALQGSFVTASFQHSWLGTHGTPEDTTVVYLVTNGSADHAIVPEPAPVQDGAKKKEVK